MATNTTSGSGRLRVARTCASGAAALFGAVATFELALAAGAPLGKAAWGGGQAHLGAGLRVASAGAAVMLGGAALVVLRRGGHSVWAPVPQRWLPRAVWGLTAYTAAGAAMNAISRSPVERAVMGPTALSLAVLCACVAAWGPKPQEADAERQTALASA